ncbi:hypothetical protein DERP_012766 [Dermatophagoides pteronyssinus]|uniref:CRIB domain-containing protein n=1 Tax=Dermatophagoides pteronyssinus TaxID=6956 RepID=A0ABQ8JQV5_DERPT|nr:hypothetical protein DERP_012766 [Dermatophagoides pteronyssinus]
MFLLQILMMIIIWMNIVVMIDGSNSIIVHRFNLNQTKWFDVRYPYKAIYGLPNSLKCQQSIYERFDQCEKTSQSDWKITIDEYFYETRKFCCFIWQTMNCEIDIAKQCNQIYSQRLEKNTIKTYQTLCNHIGYGYKGWSCWWTEERKIFVMTIVGIVMIFLMILCTVIALKQHGNYQLQNKVIEEEIPTIKEIGNPTNFKYRLHLGQHRPHKCIKVKPFLETRFGEFIINIPDEWYGVKMFKLQLLLMMMIIIMMNIVVMIDGSRSFILHGYNPNQTEWFTIRYPYKNIYGLPNSLNCHQSIYEEFDECEQSSHKDWQITIDEYFYETKKFCCFIWQTMNCEIDKAKKCNQIYSLEIEFNTRKTYQTFCDHIGYSHGSWTCWWTENRIITVSSVVGAALVLLTIFCIAYETQSDSGIAPFRYKQFRQSNILNVGGGGESSTSAAIPPPPPPPPSSQATVPTPTLTDIQKIIQQNYINTALQDFKPF